MSIKRALSFLNLLDAQDNLSITNMAVYALVVKMLVAPSLDWPSVTAMIITFTNYMHKRQSVDGSVAVEENAEMKAIKAQYESAVVSQAKAIADIQSKLSSVAALTDMMKLTRK